MIYGIGVDLVNVKRVERVLERWGDRFVGRVFTQAEAGLCRSRAFPPSAFAMRFAAKEAFSKALGTGIRQGVGWRDAGVTNEPSGKPVLHVSEAMQERLQALEIAGMQVSLSDEAGLTVAVVILEKAP